MEIFTKCLKTICFSKNLNSKIDKHLKRLVLVCFSRQAEWDRRIMSNYFKL